MVTFSSLTANDKIVTTFRDPATIISKFLPYVLTAAGMLLLVTLLWGGITLMTAAGDANKMKEGYGKITAGLIGFVLVFTSYFVAQIVQLILGVKFL